MSRAVLVVGGSSGIGLATALRLAAGGDRLMLMSRNADALSRAAAQCRDAGASTVRTVTADVLVPEEVDAAVAATVEAFGGVDAVVHTATVMAYGHLDTLPGDVFRTAVDTAVHGTLHVARAALAQFDTAGRGTLVVVNSLLGSVTVPGMGAYAVAKWGQRALVRTLQQEHRGSPGIRICIASPGSINTPIYYQAANYLGRAARPPVPVLQPERAGAVIARLLDRPRRHVSVPIGPGNPLVIFGYRFLPWVYDRIVGPLFRVAAVTGDELPAHDGNVHRATPAQERLHGHWPSVLARTKPDAG